ncbi:hypothetical protein [Chryseobacterium sp. A301]
MTTIEDLRLQYFEDCKEIIADLQEIDSEMELIDQKANLDILVEKIAFLKHCEENLLYFSEPEPILEEVMKESEQELEEEIVEESPAFNFEIAGPSIEQESEISNLETESNPESEVGKGVEAELAEETTENAMESESLQTDFEFAEDLDASTSWEESQETIEESLPVKAEHEEEEENETLELMESSTEVIEQEESVEDQEVDELEVLNSTQVQQKAQAHRIEKKIKLAHIKGLTGSVRSLFDDDALDTTPTSLQSHVASKDFSDIETQNKSKERTHFKLDLNDRIAFSKILFDGSQSDLNHTVNELNEFRNLAEAKDYLSQVYHKRDWKKVDEYAQRLWMLVENKFQ